MQLSRFFAMFLLLRIFPSFSYRMKGGRVHTGKFLARQIFMKDKDKIIDVEYSNDDTRSNNSNGISKRSSSKENPKHDENPLTSGIMKVFEGVKKTFGIDKESQIKRERKREVNTMIDKMLTGTGVLGGVVGGLMKGVGGLVLDAMADSANDVDLVRRKVETSLDMDSTTSSLLGDDIKCANPYSSSFSSSNINGFVSKSISLAMSVSGSRGEGQVEVQAALDGSGSVSFNQLIFQSSSGKVINVIGGGGGSRGGGGKIIDVEAI